MKVIFFRLDSYPDKYTNSEIDTCIASVIKRAPDTKCFLALNDRLKTIMFVVCFYYPFSYKLIRTNFQI